MGSRIYLFSGKRFYYFIQDLMQFNFLLKYSSGEIIFPCKQREGRTRRFGRLFIGLSISITYREHIQLQR